MSYLQPIESLHPQNWVLGTAEFRQFQKQTIQVWGIQFLSLVAWDSANSRTQASHQEAGRLNREGEVSKADVAWGLLEVRKPSQTIQNHPKPTSHIGLSASVEDVFLDIVLVLIVL